MGKAKSSSNLLAKEQQPPKEIFPIYRENHNEELEEQLEEQLEDKMEDMYDAFSEQLLLGVEDIDEDDLGNPTLCAEYVKDIYTYMHKLEVSGYICILSFWVVNLGSHCAMN